jgi:multiple sugar transport system ATP-binding protein
MAQIDLKDVRKSFGAVHVIKGVNLDIVDGEFMVFVGPSGCGKSTLLRLIAGLEDITSGDMLFDGQRVNDLAPSRRGIAMVFQSYALYPHMTVYENMAFGMKLAKAGAEEIRPRVERAAKMLHIDHLLDRLPKQLSGGQRQRVAIGRAIVRNPAAFLFDEPLSNLDAALRGTMRLEISELHQQLGKTMIYVTHDQVEAMTMADKIVVLNAGNASSEVTRTSPPDAALRRSGSNITRSPAAAGTSVSTAPMAVARSFFRKPRRSSPQQGCCGSGIQ